MNVGIFADALMALLGCNLHSHEQANVEVYSQGDERLNTLAVLVCHGIYRVEHHAKSLLMAVRPSQWRCSILIEANVRLTRA